MRSAPTAGEPAVGAEVLEPDEDVQQRVLRRFRKSSGTIRSVISVAMKGGNADGSSLKRLELVLKKRTPPGRRSRAQ